MTPTPTDEDYRRLLELRSGLRRFLRWSEQHAEAAGLTPAQHQLLLAIRGHGDPRGPTVGDVAGYLMLRPHSAVGLVDRAEKAGLITRGQDADNLSVVRLRLTDQGARQLEALSEQHLEELAHLAPTMHALWDALEHTRHGGPTASATRPRRRPTDTRRQTPGASGPGARRLAARHPSGSGYAPPLPSQPPLVGVEAGRG